MPREVPNSTTMRSATASSSTVNGQTTNYLLSPSGFGQVFSQYNSAGQLLSHFNYGLGTVSETTSTGASYFFDSDQLGSIVGVSDSSGAYVNQYSYLPFGQILASSGSVANSLEFTGGLGVQTDAANLLSMGAREYSPSTGAFLSGDPSQFLGGGPNLLHVCLEPAAPIH